MAISTIDKEFITYFTKLNEVQKKSLLQMIKTFLTPTIESTGRVSIEQYNKELDDAMARIDKGEFATLEELEKEMGSW